jgi:hypothetical protein
MDSGTVAGKLYEWDAQRAVGSHPAQQTLRQPVGAIELSVLSPAPRPKATATCVDA